ncbi:MATE family efflux transporter [Bradyrhizobium macuxiense]|uniref:MATE family efflux transporter n=1 Tax=Bradyrhizobium macuxiense TaxID=1755647 RepID=UPI00082CCAED|nr:MATE family efflux transporter [Bradyrhizobium macuxiense]
MIPIEKNIRNTTGIALGLRLKTRTARLAVELSQTAKLALPSVLAELGQAVMMITDLAFIGHISADALAAAALASRIYLVGLTFGTGLMSAVAPLAAQAFGSDNPGLVRRSLRVGLWAALLLSLPIIAFALCGEQILVAFGQAPETTRLAQQYLFGLAWGILPVLWFRALRSFMIAVKRPEPLLWITLAAIPVNFLLVYLLVYGRCGLPRLELFGAGFATSLVNCAILLVALWFAIRRRPFSDYHLLAHLWHVDWPLMRELIVIGAPSSMALLMEYGLFSAAALLMGLIGTTALAAHQIAFNIAAILFKIPIGIGMAATVRVAHAVGRNDHPGIRRAGLVAMLLGVAIAAVLMVIVIAARLELVRMFLDDAGDKADATIELAGTLLLVAASFVITETLETIAMGCLRGLKDTRIPLLFTGVGYWLVGMLSSYALSLQIGLGAVGVWIGLSIGTTVYAALLILRFLALTNKLALQNGAPRRPIVDQPQSGTRYR